MNILFTKILSIKFKGQRNYVYASDVFMEVIQLLKDNFPIEKIEKIDFSTHKMAHNQLEFALSDQPPKDIPDLQSIFNFIYQEKDYYGFLKETNKEIITNTEYDEKDLFKQFDLDLSGKCVSFSGKSQYSIMDIFTSLNKHLLSSLFPQVDQGWLSVRVKLNKLFSDNYKELKVVFNKDFAGRYFQSTLYFNENPVGQIYFTPKTS